MIVSPHLKQAHSADQARQHELSVPGMAHFGGSGPEGTFCHECSWWQPSPEAKSPRVRRDSDGYLKPRRCRKYPRLMQGQDGPGVRPTQASCRYYAAIENPPEVHIDPEVARAERNAARALKRKSKAQRK
ncbi:MAG: hypothetical protein O9972_09675 [Burkholderiales bacterium]|nr:hypothetical protein [Burkholderiales bacterium]